MSCLDWSSDNKRLASGSWDKTVRIWHIEEGICVSELTVRWYHCFCGRHQHRGSEPAVNADRALTVDRYDVTEI